MPNALAIPEIKRHAVAVYEDTERYKCRFDVRSESSDKIYRISFDAAPGAGYFSCSCPGGIRYGRCKHLDSMGLPGRKQGRSKEWVIKLLGVNR